LLLLVTTGPILGHLVAWVERYRRLRRIGRTSLPLDGLPPASQTLRQLGLDDTTIDRITQRSSSSEVRIATFDQHNRVLSDIGPIPFFEGVQVTPGEFRRRALHLVELVIARGVVCVKKTYRDRSCFESELLALHAVAGIRGVPQLVAVQLGSRVVYQSFIVGRNLGGLMARHGATVHIQHQVSVSYWGRERWNPKTTAQAREAAIAALSASVNPRTIAEIGRLVEQIHHRGVTIGDVKYGNVLLVEGEPFLCDFDHAKAFTRNGWRCVKEREADRDGFNYFFDCDLLSEWTFRSTAALLACERKELAAARICYGHGYENQRTGSLELGSGRWQFIRSHLPDLVGKSILDLGCSDALLPLQMLRTGARQVTAYEHDPVMVRYGRLNHRWFEFIDNRPYAGFQLVEGFMHEACDRDWSGYDMATAFCSLYREEPEQMARIVRALSRTIDCFIVQANQNRDEYSGRLGERSSLAFLQALLQANGYPDQTVVELSFYDRPLLIGRRSKTCYGLDTR